MCDDSVLDSAREYYDSTSSVWPADDIWHNHTKLKIDEIVINWYTNFFDKFGRVLNAGSGGQTYGITEELWHVDVAATKVNNFINNHVSSITNMPFPDDYFDGAICVGSVINYCDSLSALAEITRTLRNNGLLILEFERSESIEMLFKKGYRASSYPMIYELDNTPHKLWLHSENHIMNLLKAMRYSIIHITRFHSVSNLLLKLGIPMNRAMKAVIFDPYIGNILSSVFAHNSILLAQKLL